MKLEIVPENVPVGVLFIKQKKGLCFCKKTTKTLFLKYRPLIAIYWHLLLARCSLKLLAVNIFGGGVLFISVWQIHHNTVLQSCLHVFYLYTLFVHVSILALWVQRTAGHGTISWLNEDKCI